MSKINMIAVTKCISAVQRICINIAGSDFATDYGNKAAYSLREYAADMATDVFIALEGRFPSNDEMECIAEGFTEKAWMDAFFEVRSNSFVI
jgi:hypothetical protein